MEEALFVTRFDDLGHFDRKYTRLYFGQEFCERLIPSPDELRKVLEFVREKSLAFTFVTPYLTEDGLAQWDKLLPLVAQSIPDAEIVLNDWGFLHHIRDRCPGVVRVLGRLLTKQKRGPQLMAVLDKVPSTMLDHFRRSNVDVPLYIDFLKENGVTRVELDNLLQGMERVSPLPASLYHPWMYISTTRMCLTNSCHARTAPMRAIFPCGRECRRLRFRLTHADMPVPVFLAGNTQFCRNDTIPGELERLGVSRLVYEPEVPI